MKAVLISIQPKWVEKIANDKKTIEVRKTRPNLETPFKVYIYETKGKKVECGFHFEETGRTLREKYVFGMHEAKIVKHYCNEGQGKVIGEFVCDDIDTVRVFNDILYCVKNSQANKLGQMCLTIEEVKAYLGDYNGYNWHISNLVIYDKPKELSEFKIIGCKGCKDKDTYHCIFHCFGKRKITRPPMSWCYVEKGE